ncbi:MAG: ABC transporter ATP-binding protein [Egibacteraceae bacterium]
MSALLEVDDLAVRFGDVDALRGVSLRLDRGQSLAIVGETGSGKSTLAHCLTGLVQPPRATGSVRIDGQELLGAAPETLRGLRWRTVALALQGAPFNPVATVGEQVSEPLRAHLGMGAAQARERAGQLAAELLLDTAALARYPHQLSGGERRRAALAAVVALDPALVILDEPTAGLDPATSRDLIDRVRSLAATRGFALVVISHDLPAAARLASRSAVLYAGELMETGATDRVIGEPTHPYSWALVNAYPVMTTTKDLRPIRGSPPDPRDVPAGCPFHPRCPQAEAVCWEEHPPLEASRGRLVACHFGGLKTMLTATDLHRGFGSGRARTRVLHGVSLTVRAGEAVGVIGPSGSGKTTLARILAGHLQPDAGAVELEGAPLPGSWKQAARALRRRVQLVLQDPWDALSPRLTVAQLVREPLDVAAAGDAEERDSAARTELAGVGLPTSPGFLAARTHELSGGQLQRVALARALIVRPRVLVADEPTSMLDASEQARLLVLLRERHVELGLALVLVSHDLAVVRKVTDRIVVLEAGRVVEEGPSHLVSSAPRSVTARRMLDASPILAPIEANPGLDTPDDGGLEMAATEGG